MEVVEWSATDGARGPAHLVLTASVARRYYLDGRSKVEIAEEFALSRFKVARLLEDARSSGLVRIEIGHPGVVDVELSGTADGRARAAALRRHRHPRRRPGLPARAPRRGRRRAAHRDRHPRRRARAVLGPIGQRDGHGAAAAGPRARRAAHRGAGPARRGRQLDRAGPRGRQGVRRAGVLLLRPDGGAGRRHRAGAAPPARGGAGVLPHRVGHHGRGGRRGLGPRAVHALRRHRRGRARRAGAGAGCAPRSPACSSTPPASPCAPASPSG